MQRNKAQPMLVNRRFDHLSNGVFDFAVARVAPPQKHVVSR